MSILYDLWEGKIAPWERPFTAVPGYQQAAERLAGTDAVLRRELGAAQKELLDRVQREENEIQCICLEEMFRYGFSLGARVMLEVLEDGA